MRGASVFALATMGYLNDPSRPIEGAAPRSSRRTKGWIAGGSLLFLSLLGFLLLSGPDDPVFQGIPLSRHLKRIEVSGISHGGVESDPGHSHRLISPRLLISQSNPDATRAIRSVGTNALPLLVGLLKSKDSRLKHLAWEFSWKVRERFPRLKKWFPANLEWAFGDQVCALAAFEELGPLAAPAIPSIRPLLKDPDLALVATVALISIQPEGEQDILSLTNVLGITVTGASGMDLALLHSTALLALSSFGTRAAAARPLIVDCLNSTDARLQASAAIALARTGASADEVVPRIVSRIVDGLADIETNPPSVGSRLPPRIALRVGREAWPLSASEPGRAVLMHVFALGQFGTNAVAALPALSKLRSHPDAVLRTAVEDALVRIENGADWPANAGR